MADAKKAPAKSKKTISKAKAGSSKTTKKSAESKSSQDNPFKNMENFMTQTPFQFDKIAEDAANMGQAQMNAAVKSSTLFFKGMEDIMKTCMSMAQDSGEKATEATKKLMACKTLNEYTDAQAKVAQANFDDFMAGATKISEMTVKVCTEALEPINDQMSQSLKKANKAAA